MRGILPLARKTDDEENAFDPTMNGGHEGLHRVRG